MATGSVARFDVRRGYGFVIPDDGGEDVFVHQNNIVMDGFRYLKAGEHVSYELEVGEKGMKAVSVQLLDPRPPEPEREPRQQRQPRESQRSDRDDSDGYRNGRAERNGRSGSNQGGDDSGEVRRLRRKVERLISILVERNVLSPGEIDAVDNGFAAAHVAQQPAIDVAVYDEDDEDDQ